MYVKKIEYFQEMYPEKNCLSGMLINNVDHLAVGTPCVAIINPFNICKWPEPGPSFKSPKSKYQYGFDDEPILDGDSSNTTKPKTEKTHASDLYKMDQSEMNKIFHRSVSRADVLFLFNARSYNNDFYNKTVVSKCIRLSKKKPIIYDTSRHISLYRLADVYDSEELNNFPTIIAEDLKSFRYTNYTFSDVSRSNIRYMIEDINKIFNILTKVYKYATCFYQYTGEPTRLLIDTVSIGFYQLNDVIPIFDNKRSDGLCIEIFLTNSRKSITNIIHNYSSMTYRFILSASKENVFTIDGELIQRPNDTTIGSALSRLSTRLAEDSPNDTVIKRNKASLKKKEGGITCVE